MKILFVTATYPPSTNGVSISVSSLYYEMRRRSHEVFVLAPANGKTNDPKGVYRYPSIPNPFIPDYPIPLFPLTPKIIKLLIKTKFDVVHAQHPFYISFFANLIASHKKLPFVFTYHTRYGQYVRTYLKRLPKHYLNLIDKYVFSSVFGKCNLVVAPSEAIRKYLLGLGVRKNIAVVPSGIPIKKVHMDLPVVLRKKYGISGKARVALCVSRLGKEKNLEFLLNVLKKLDNKYVLAVVGIGPELDGLKAKATSLGVDKRTMFLGKIEHEKIGEIYSIADVFVFPSYTETQGLVLLEAQYYGVPVVAVNNPVNKEWVSGGIIVEADYQLFADSIEKAIKNKTLFSRRGKKFARQFTVLRVVDKLIRIYSSLIKVAQ